MFYIFLLFGLILRLVLIPIPGFKADVAFWKGWGLAAADKGVLWMMTNTNYNYPPGFSYILWLINKVYAFFKDAHNINEYWLDGNVFYLFLLKLITIAADLLIVWLIIKIGHVILRAKPEGSLANARNKSETSSEILPPSIRGQNDKLIKIFALFYFLNPAVIYDGVVWGQVDQFGLALFLLSAYLLLKEKPLWASVVFTISCLMKFQNIIFIPLFYLFIWRRFSFEALARSLGISFITFIIVIFPFFLNKQMERLIWLLTINADWFPWYSLNAFNIWWILSGLKGMQIIDKHLVIGITSAKQFGLFIFSFAYFIGVITVIFSKKDDMFKSFILACTLAVFGFFHILTQSHERYLFPAMGLLLILGILGGFGRLGRFWFFSIFYFLVSIFFFLNMYLSLGWNYPDQVIPTFTRDQTLGLSWWISVAQIILFVIFVVWYIREIGVIREIRMIAAIGGFGAILIAALLFKNLNYYLGKPVSLTAMRPVGFRQDYLQPVYNKTVESDRGVKYWNRLSVNYYFYEKGIGSHADSDITYHLAKKFAKFSTDFGIDTEGDQSAKVYFSIIGDGRELFKSDVKGRFDRPGTSTVDVRGVNYLSLKISKATDSIFGAHADWLNPVVIH